MDDGTGADAGPRGGSASGPPVPAAGGIVWRQDEGGPRIAVIHRPRYDDWSLPKGKAEPGEHLVVTARREVAEETGEQAVCGPPAGEQRYLVTDSDGSRRLKIVRYWVMAAAPAREGAGSAFTPGDEVDDLRWLPVAKALNMLTYERDRALVKSAEAWLMPTRTVLLVRHGQAGRRSEWPGPDIARPLEETGRLQARRLRDVGVCFGPRRIVSAPPLRCVQTLEPLAEAVGLPVLTDEAFGDGTAACSPAASAAALRRLAARGNAAVCGQGKSNPAIVADLAAADGLPITRPRARKGSVWSLTFADARLTAAEYFADLEPAR